MTKLYVLENKIPVILDKMKNVQSASIGVCFEVGSVNETDNQLGISHFVEHLLFRGSENRSGTDIFDTIDHIGGEINGFTSKELTVYHATVLGRYSSLAIDVISDMIIHPKFSDDSIDKERAIILEEILSLDNDNQAKTHAINLQNVFKNHALGNPIFGTFNSILGISKEDIWNHYNKYYIPQNLSIVVSGNFDEGEVLAQIKDIWSKWKIDSIAKKKVINKTFFDPIHESNLVDAETTQIHLCVNATGTTYHKIDEYYILQVISHVLGVGTSSRLFSKIREDHALAYSVFSYLSTYGNSGLFTTYVGTVRDNYQRVLDLIFEEYGRLKTNFVSYRELERAKNQIISSVILDLESSKSQMFRSMNDYLAHNKVIGLEDLEMKIRSISEYDIIELSREKFKKNSFTALGKV